jgi:FdhD protein
MHFYVLAGGKSRRFGINKALAVIEGKTVIARVIAAIPQDRAIFIVTNSPSEYAHLPLPTLPDKFPGAGPLAGIHAGLLHAPDEWNFFLACDFPCLQSSVIHEICVAPRQAQVILPETPDGLQPLCALWSKSTLPVIETALQSNERSVRVILQKLHAHNISLSKPESLLNLNTPEDLSQLRSGLG